MTSPLVRAAVAVIRLWGWCYTQGLPPDVRTRRRDEIASDVWHQVFEGEEHPMYLVVQLFWRLVSGLADDIAWSFEQRQPGWFWRRTIVATALLAFAVIVTRWTTTRMPTPPAPPPPALTVHVASPPPPPPPLDRRGGSIAVDFTYGETSYIVTPQATAPHRLKEVRPIYPPLLKDAAVEGVVVVRGRITEDGRVADAHVEPAGLLGQSAINAVRQWEFAPSQLTDARSDRLLTVSVKFSSAK